MMNPHIFEKQIENVCLEMGNIKVILNEANWEEVIPGDCEFKHNVRGTTCMILLACGDGYDYE